MCIPVDQLTSQNYLTGYSHDGYSIIESVRLAEALEKEKAKVLLLEQIQALPISKGTKNALIKEFALELVQDADGKRDSKAA